MFQNFIPLSKAKAYKTSKFFWLQLAAEVVFNWPFYTNLLLLTSIIFEVTLKLGTHSYTHTGETEEFLR